MYFGAIDNLNGYFANNNIRIPKGVNPAEFMIDVVSGDLSKGRDWAEVWRGSENCKAMGKELEDLKAAWKGKNVESKDDQYEYASTSAMQLRLVTKRASVQVS